MAGNDASTPRPAGGIAVILGASGGIGAALAEACRAGGQFDEVVEASRKGPLRFDLRDEESIAAVASDLSGRGEIRLMIDATGLLWNERIDPEKSWRQIDPEALAEAFAINTIGPALLMKHLLPCLPRQGRSVFATLSARVGSIGDNRLGGWYGYRASKAALNQMVRTASVELARQRRDAICVALHPGTVDTRLSQPFARSGLKVQSPAEASHHLLQVINGLGSQDSGGFFDWKGEAVQW